MQNPMARAPSYTVEHAARRMGVTPSRVNQMIGNELVKVSERPLRVNGDEVEAFRARNLEKFEDVADLSAESTHPLALATRARRAEDWLRSVGACRELVDEGVERIRRGERILIDALLAGLPADDVI